MLLMGSVLLMTARAQEPDNNGGSELKSFFQVTVRQGPSTGLVAYGVLTMNVNAETGDFTGTLTPAVGEDTGKPLPSVLFKQTADSFVPDPSGVMEIAVRGTMHGHAINLMLLDVRGVGKNIVGVGTMENTLAEQLQGKGHGVVAGPAVGPEDGDSGDWLVPCCSIH
jgi:hypothetical protein